MPIDERPNSILDNLISIVDRNLTFIAIGVAAVGVLLIVTGPTGGLFGGGRNRDSADVRPQTQPDDEQAVVEANPAASEQQSEEIEQVFSAVIERAPQPFTIVPARERGDVITYIIEPGDTLFDLSAYYGISKETIFWSNSSTLRQDVHLLIPGTEIYVLPVDGVYYRASGDETIAQIATRFLAIAEDILESPFNELAQDSTEVFRPALGMWLVIPDGQRERVDFDWFPPQPASSSGSSGSVVRSFAPGHPGSCAPVTGGGGTGAWASPIGNYTLVQGFFYGHSGLDLSAVLGEPILAADTGRVIFAGWNNWGFGNLVVLDHGNGWTTFYAHMSSVSVGCGQLVSRGSRVGGVGSTGNSTGAHLHFEMRWFLNPDNPAAYIGF